MTQSHINNSNDDFTKAEKEVLPLDKDKTTDCGLHSKKGRKTITPEMEELLFNLFYKICEAEIERYINSQEELCRETQTKQH